MKKILLSILLLAGLSAKLSAQCITINCPSPVSANNDAGVCGAVVNYTAPTMSSACTITATDTFNFTGAMQTYVVPAGVTTITIETWGAQGGANWVNNVNYGGYSKADFAVTPGETLYIFVGGQATSIIGGFNGGGTGEGAGKGGGGGTDVRQGGTTLNDRIIVGGGGGGAGYWSNLHVVGGVGGGMTGGDGYRNTTADPGGLGGTQTGPGASGTCINFNVTAMAGGFGYGGSTNSCGCEGYGGGGGWYGGAASGNCRGGGGGSGYILPIAANPTMTAGVRVGDGRVVIGVNTTTTPTLAQTAGLPSGSTFPVGVTTNSFTASDALGNSNTCSFTVTIADNEAPVISGCPSDITMCEGVVTFANTVTAVDNCSVASTTQTSGPASGDNLAAGNYTVTYTSIDQAGNSSTCSFTITVNPNPAVTANSTATTICSGDPVTLSGSGGAVSYAWSGSVTDNVAFNPTTTDTYTVTGTDANGCTNTDMITVNVNALPPVVGNATATTICEGAAVTLSGSGAASYTWTGNVTDNVAFNPTTTDTYTVTGTDANGCVNTDEITVTVNPAPPVLGNASQTEVCAGSPVTLTGSGAVSYTWSGSVTDNTPFTPAATDTYTVTGIDANGCTNTDEITVTVNPLPSVTLSLPVATMCVDDANLTLTGGNPVSGSWSGTGVTGSSFDPTVAGTTTITYSYTDANGCDGSATDNIVVSLCTGITEQGITVFSMYPNPASAYFTFVTAEQGVMDIMDINGQVVKTEKIVSNKQEINLAGLATGTYLVRFVTVEGNVSAGRLLIQE
jgi:hypothetical protein